MAISLRVVSNNRIAEQPREHAQLAKRLRVVSNNRIAELASSGNW